LQNPREARFSRGSANFPYEQPLISQDKKFGEPNFYLVDSGDIKGLRVEKNKNALFLTLTDDGFSPRPIRIVDERRLVNLLFNSIAGRPFPHCGGRWPAEPAG
jgi:hypothetical protein